jgi:hypothetical protein
VRFIEFIPPRRLIFPFIVINKESSSNMAPHRSRGHTGGSRTADTSSRSSRTTPMGSAETSSRSEIDSETPDESVTSSNSKQRSSVWDRRRRRLDKKQSSPSGDAGVDAGESSQSRNRGRSKQKEQELEEELDPYDSDPGESYRDHCMKVNGFGTKSCMPNFIQKRISRGDEETTVMTTPPSPMQSEMGDLFGPVPASLPPSMMQVRYSLRSSITDGSEKQPSGPSVMERRELRPNNVKLNVSHWSDTGGRPYMEDRYVIAKLSLCEYNTCMPRHWPLSHTFYFTLTFLQIRD